MRLPVPLSASIAVHGAALAFISISPYVASLPPSPLEVTIRRLMPAVQNQGGPASAAHALRPHQVTPSIPAIHATEDEKIAEPTMSASSSSVIAAVGELSRAPAVAASVVAPPRFDAAYLDNPEPTYPAVARRRGIEGLVMLEVWVDAQGHPLRIRVAERSGEDSLDQAAVDAVRGWRFSPAMRGDEPVEGSVRVPIRFRLHRSL